jgi:hypothetical protein
MEQETRSKDMIFVIKISGPKIAFISEIAQKIKESFLVVLESKPKENDAGSGYHVFLTIVNAGKATPKHVEEAAYQ